MCRIYILYSAQDEIAMRLGRRNIYTNITNLKNKKKEGTNTKLKFITNFMNWQCIAIKSYVLSKTTII